MKLDLTNFKKAVAQLEESMAYYRAYQSAEDPKLALLLRAAAIQTFEFTYELSWKMLKRYLVMTSPNPSEFDDMTFNNLIRRGYGQGLLLSDVAIWKHYRRERGTTSHTYNKKKANEVINSVDDFLNDAKHLLAQLEARNNEKSPSN